MIHDSGHKGFHIPLLQAGPGKAVDITLPIEEGDQYRLGEITFKGNKALSNTKALRTIFPIKDGDVFDRSKIAKGLESLGKAYGQYGYINFTSIPDTRFDEDKKIIFIDIDVDEGKQFYVRRIEFQGNTTTRDKVIRREILLEEGSVYNQQLWEVSLQRLNQLGFFDNLKPDDPSVTERHLNEKDGTVDLLLKVREKGKNSIGLTGGVSGLAGSFIGLSYSTNNFLGKGETLAVQANLGNLQRSLSFCFTEPYLFDRPLQFGFTMYATRFIYDQARQAAILSGQQISLAYRSGAEPAELHPGQQGVQHQSFSSDPPLVQAGRPQLPARRFLHRGSHHRFERPCSTSLRLAESAARTPSTASSPARLFPATPRTRWTGRCFPIAVPRFPRPRKLPVWEEPSEPSVPLSSTNIGSRYKKNAIPSVIASWVRS